MVKDLRTRIETGFEAYGRFVTAKSWLVLFLSLMVVGTLASNLPKTVMDTATESFLHKDDPALLAYNEFRDQFGRDELVVVAIETDDVFDPAFLKKLKKLHNELRDNTPYLDDITSLINARNTFGKEDELLVEDLFQEWPTTPAEFEEKRTRAYANPLFENTFLSEDRKITAIVMRTDVYTHEGIEEDALGGFDDLSAPTGDTKVERAFLSDKENSELVEAVERIAYSYDGPNFKVYASGSTVVADALKKAMQTNMARFTLMGLGVIGVVLFIMFRRPSGVVLPLIIVVLSVLGTLGLLPLTGRAFTLPMQILPSFLLAVGVGAAVHFLAIFFRQVQSGHSRADSVIYTMGHSGLPIVMTSVTTAAGLASFSGAEVAPVADLGIITALGIMLSLLLNLSLLPAALTLLPLKAKSSDRAHSRHKRMDDLLKSISKFSVERANVVLGVTAILLVIAVAGLTQLKFSHKPFDWLSPSEPSRQAIELIDDRLKGASSIEVVIDTKKVNGLYDPKILAGLDKLGTDILNFDSDYIEVGKALSLADILKETNRALHANDDAFYTIPTDKDLIAQELFLFENSGSDDMEDFVDSQFRKARFTIKMPWADAVHLQEIDEQITAEFRAVLGDEVGISVTGMNALLGRTMEATIFSMAESYVIAAVVITVMMMIFLGSPSIGLISMIPNLSPIIITLGIMGWFAIPLDLFTMLIGAIAIGLAVDDTIHFMHNYRRYHQKTGSVQIAVTETLLGTGRAMMVTTIVLSLGFIIYMMSTLSNLINFGWLVAMSIILALLADLFLAPALMAILHKTHILPDDSDF